MPHAEAARGTGEPSVSDERNLVAHALAIERRGGRQHLAHAGAALGALVADDDDIALVIFFGADGGESLFLAVEAAGGSTEFQILQSGHLDDGAIWRKRSPQPHDAAGRRQRIVSRTLDILVRVP